ncbi:hypothetical protein A3H53_01095 [Candidatus Nomurabacteria bacterium RIFCSPLOWO2_02_FULL_40_10]|uniref:Ig-like domain-containing protein n=1 Tax=Candidatus Nomurabacteria bacterium RIFCSPLOWO2_02_FULL_40_10 TaxID=1801786 RepID=A0A1F6XXZ5_9BACT|nr:MAG: hypothetical protein A3H53_01095 [Candidatus Nomurabacteria bacterium RIFCSPLOWO2_02_FULL_40_10]OGZ72980.1 MAG: hypothetical protein A3A98_03155 [Candidatus Staskawiczbacteria bacterium RIFCSPLOWO2_01_FULL_40_39]
MNLFKKSSLWKLIAAIFTLSLHAHIAEAKGTGIATFLGIFISIVLIVIGTVLSGGLLGGILLQQTAALVGQIQCQAGQNNAFFTGCSDQASSGGSTQQAGTPGSPVLLNENYTATCNSVSLTYDVSGANQYGIYRDGNLINQGSAQGLSKIIYTDSNLNKQATYAYQLIMTDNQGTQFQYPVMNAYTKCLSQCSFTTNKSEIITPAQATLSWSCQDANSCAISPGVGSVNPQTGQTTVAPTASTTYILTCSNIDGETSFSTNINVKKPKLEEVIP